MKDIITLGISIQCFLLLSCWSKKRLVNLSTVRVLCQVLQLFPWEQDKGFSKTPRHTKPSPAEQLAHVPTYVSEFVSTCAMKIKRTEQMCTLESSEINRPCKKEVFKCFAQFRLELISPRESRSLDYFTVTWMQAKLHGFDVFNQWVYMKSKKKLVHDINKATRIEVSPTTSFLLSQKLSKNLSI